MGFAAVGQLTRRCGRLCGASLSLGSVLHHQTSTGRPLAGLASCERPCLVDGGFPPSGPQEDLTYCMSHLVVLCSCRAHQGSPPLRRRFATLTCTMRSRRTSLCRSVRQHGVCQTGRDLDPTKMLKGDL